MSTSNAPRMAEPLDPARRQWLFGGAMAATAGLSLAVSPRATPPSLSGGGLEVAIPRRLGRWQVVANQGLVLPPPDEVQSDVYDQLLTRTYADGEGPPVMLLIAYGGGKLGVFEVHRPEACYPAQGFALSGRARLQLSVGPHISVPATFWSAVSDVRTEQLLYWTRIGGEYPEGWINAHWAAVRNNLARRLPDGALVRMSVLSNDPAASAARLKEFARTLILAADATGRRMMLGSN